MRRRLLARKYACRRGRQGTEASRGLPRAPACGVVFARIPGVGSRRDRHADLGLPVALDGGLCGAAAFLAPDQRELIADLDVRIDNPQREHAVLVVAVAAEHGVADRL